MSDKVRVNVPGKVEKVITASNPNEPEQADISVNGADPLHREFRIANSLRDDNGNEVRLKEGSDVNVIFESEEDTKKPG